MVVAFDNNILCLLLHPDADIPNDPATGAPVVRAQDRMSYLVERLREVGARLLIPAPVLSEFLTYADPEYLVEINQSAYFEIAPFGERAAVEAAQALRRAIREGKGKKLGSKSPWQKVKIDWQIAAIAKVGNATEVYTTDPDVATIASYGGLRAIHIADLPLPPSEEPRLPFDHGTASPPSDSTEPEPPSGQSPDDEPMKG